ncbi:hypothetical protein [Bordetella bronchiseptica]
MNMRIFQAGLVRHIVDGAKVDSARSLDLLRAIEDTVDANNVFARTFSALASNCAGATESICNISIEKRKEIDADGAICTGIESAIDRLRDLVGVLQRKRAAAVADTQLRNEDGVASSFESAISAILNARDELNELKWAVMEHDADLAPIVGPFDSVEQLISALRS